ncbi:TIGR04219 family outer membrane beta-barrel protein [Alteromonas sp. CYL-A6]|uniref:TIGR04219 family outer membrane beta-barrel protein n=1 Tax=Alteromonas nitratireducens TaxID=3390813 RepID=UPI0034B005B2
MKKLILAALLGSAFSLSSAHADTVLGVYAGAQGWDTSTSGGFASNNDAADFNFKDQTTGVFYIAFEHPVPFIPNLKVNHTTLDTNGLTTLSTDVEFEGVTYTASTEVNALSDITSTDFILYYELFDNDVVSFDVGLNGKYIDGTMMLEDTQTNESATGDFSGIIPMLYSRVQVGIPFSGLSAYAEGSYLSFDGHSLSDYQVALAYSFIESMAVDMTVQLGYRNIEIDIEDLDDIYANMEFDGVFAGLEVHF